MSMSGHRPIFVLGADDAEMATIESLLRECGQPFVYALGPLPRETEAGDLATLRVRPGQVAVAVGEVYSTGDVVWYDLAVHFPGREVVAIEVAGLWGQPQIDHHDGAERAEWGPERFLQASSLGQVIERLAQMGALPTSWGGDFLESIGARDEADGAFIDSPGGIAVVSAGCFRIVPQALVFEAAADHCPAAAIAGQCPGVEPEEFAPFLAESKRRQYFPWMSPADFSRELEISRAALLAAPPVTEFCDPHPAGFSPDLEEVYIVGADPEDCPVGAWIAPEGDEDDGDGDAGLIRLDWLYICRHEPDGTPVGVVATPQMLAMRDLRHLEPGTVPAQGSGECYPAEFLVGIVAALFEGVGFVCRIRRRDGKLALRSNGHGQGTLAGTRPAEVFLSDPAAFGCGPRFPPGQDASYGNSARGFFGGLLTNQD